VSDVFNLGWDDYTINQAAYQGEIGVHGNPSGIDNTAAVFGGLFSFQKNVIKNITIKKSIDIVLADSGVENNTKAVLEEVKLFRQNNRTNVDLLFQDFLDLFFHATSALQDFDLKTVGMFMNKNHELLQKLHVSCPELDQMVEIARSAGAYGAKLTGTGKGGVMLALTPGKELQDCVAQHLQNAGYFVCKTSISRG
jgi:mevalonate kinase